MKKSCLNSRYTIIFPSRKLVEGKKSETANQERTKHQNMHAPRNLCVKEEKQVILLIIDPQVKIEYNLTPPSFHSRKNLKIAD